MATKTDFTEEEWETLQKGVTGAGFWMTIADRGFFDTFKESSALAKHLAEARKSSESTLVRDLGETKGTGFGWRSSPEEIEGLTQIQGNITDHEYEISGPSGKVASVGKRWFRLTDTYGVEVEPGQDDGLVLAVAVVVDQISHPRG